MRKVYTAISNKYYFFVLSLLIGLMPSLSNGQTVTPYTTPGTYNFTVPDGVYAITVSAWGGGGAGGGVTTQDRAGGGGEGGSFVRGTITVTPGQIYTVIVGNGGTGADEVTGTSGQASYFATGATKLFNAIGGAGGARGINFGAGGNSTNTGNIISGSFTSSYYGGNGGSATNASVASSGGGGGSAGAGGNGGNGGSPLTGGNAGSGLGTPLDAGAAGAIGRGSQSDGDGRNGDAPGAGGSGSRNANNNTDYRGGHGGNGQVIISYASPYKDQWISMNTGSLTWCPGETRTVSITVKNIGTQAWTSGGTVNVNMSYYWSNQGRDNNPRILPFSNLLPGQQQTINVAVTAPLTGSPLTLNFDLVKDGAFWFGDNNGGGGPGNVVFKSSPITINSVPAQPSAITGNTPVCPGSTETYTVTNVPGVTYAWNTPTGWNIQSGQGTNSVTYLVGNTNRTVQVTPSNSCGNGASQSLAVTLKAIASGTLTTPKTTICVGDVVIFTATPGYDLYEFYVNNVLITSNNTGLYSNGALANNDQVKVKVFSNNCTIFFNTITMTVNPLPTVTLTANPATAICPGTPVTFTATGGTNYILNINGNPIESNTTGIFSSNSLHDGDNVTVDVTDGNSCNATSSPITMSVKLVPTGTLISNPSPPEICAGQPITFTAKSGFTTYEFFVTGASVQGPTGSNTYTTSTLTNGQIVSVIATNSGGCSAQLGAIPVTINPLPVGNIAATENSSTQDDNIICAGENVKFTVTPSGLTNYKYYLNGAGAALYNGNSNVYNTTGLTNGDYMTCLPEH